MHRSVDIKTAPADPSPLRRSASAALAIIPVSMLFGVLAERADWSWWEVALVGLLGFTGSGQFAALPLAQSGAGFMTLLVLTASINSRYLPIALMSAPRLPRSRLKKAVTAHMLGDEAYATERESDRPADIVVIRATIFLTWVMAGVLGSLLGQLMPREWINTDLNLGYPASAVLLYLSIAQLRLRLTGRRRQALPLTLIIAACAGVALLMITWLGPVHFWIPSVLIATVLLTKAKL